jgi:hypothetical protein
VPEVVTQEDDVVATELIFLGRKRSSQPGLNADQRKEVRGHAHRLQPFRLAHPREAHAEAADHGQVVDGPSAASPFLEVRQIDRCGARRPADAEEFVDATSRSASRDRTLMTAHGFMADVAARLANRVQLTTDGHRP